jgi:EAL and modified HD-GYP domain-containing signal transduction protein
MSRDLATAASSAAAAGQVFVARQPILDRAQRVFGYELLFRSSVQAETSAGAASEQASARVITDAVLSFGLDALTQGRPAFINVTRSLLLDGMPAALPPHRVVLELLEGIEADEDVLAACRELRQAGYAIALDDFVLNDRTAGLVPLADYIKVDCLAQPDPAARREILALKRGGRPALVAEKIETVHEFERAMQEGFEYFQGFFFGRPVTSGARQIPGDQIGHLRLLHALQNRDLTIDSLEHLIKHDTSLCYRVLRTVNSAGYAQHRTVQSIRQALVLLGVDTVRRWTSLWVLAGLSHGAQQELVVMSTVRARYCELLAGSTGGDEAASLGFLLGMCSMLDAILERPIECVLAELSLPDPAAAALRGEDNGCRRLLDCAVAYERGEWDRSLHLARRAGLDPPTLPIAHKDALRWAADFHRAV